MGLGLLVINAALNNVKQMRDDTTGCEAMADIIEIKSPRVRKPTGENLELFFDRMKSPDSGIDEISILFRSAGFPDPRLSENPVASIQPTVRAPDEAIQRFVSVLEAPTVEQDLRFPVRDIIAIRIRNEKQLRWRAEINTSKSHRYPRGKFDLIREQLLRVKDTIAIGIFKDLNSAENLILLVAPSIDVVVVLHNPESTAVVEGEGDGFSNVWFRRKDRDFESLGDLHRCDGFVGFQKRRVAAFVLLPALCEGRG